MPQTRDRMFLICNFSSLATTNGDAVFSSKLVKAIESLQAVTYQNEWKTPILPKETNLEARTRFNEICWIPLRNLKRFFRMLQAADVIHLNPFNFSDILISCVLMLMGKKTIFTMHANIHFKFRETVKILENIRFLICFNFHALAVDRVAFVTRAQQQAFLRYCPWKRTVRRKAVVILNAIESGRILDRKTRLDSSLSVLFVGRLERVKGIHDLMHAAKQVEREDIFFFVAGRGDLAPDASVSAKISFLGSVPNEELDAVYDRSDILIVPSYTESFSIVILEAMSRGLAILSSDLPCIREFLQEGRNAYFFPAGDVEAMTAKLLKLHRDRQDLARIGENNLWDARKFTVENQARQYHRLYEELASHD